MSDQWSIDEGHAVQAADGSIWAPVFNQATGEYGVDSDGDIAYVPLEQQSGGYEDSAEQDYLQARDAYLASPDSPRNVDVDRFDAAAANDKAVTWDDAAAIYQQDRTRRLTQSPLDSLIDDVIAEQSRDVPA